MLTKTQSISARLAPDDYAYLMSIDRNGAVTQSEKIRELIAMARESVGVESFARSYIAAGETILPIRARYAGENQRSLLVEALMEMVAEGAAAIQACAGAEPMAPALEEKALPIAESFLERIFLITRQEQPHLARPEIAGQLKNKVGELSQPPEEFTNRGTEQ
ncbi:hypothetical protein [Microbulbifer yueqingensis]|uniref:Uncharacterized protein n=1 Tax=Microbulbifer yueqingensis TaxID=658219 RepID=A0A1G9C1W2_9GAMM|nr:hypothetical protein [Microbulbifer yueqingensis]SDK45677.1 hypothetical protein SAMN05216212_2449 [Microbulbifer yueqingensis]